METIYNPRKEETSPTSTEIHLLGDEEKQA